MPTTIIFHADCLDGFGAAYAAWRKFGDSATYLPLHHGDPWPLADQAGRDVFILDFSFARETLIELAGIAASVFLLDHHASARAVWADRLRQAPDGLERFSHPALPLTVAFDLNKSGARLAWEHFHPATPVPAAIAHIEDQDLWRFALPGTRAFNRALRLQPFEFAAWDGIVRAAEHADAPDYRRLLCDGEAIERFCALEVERLAGGALPMRVALRGEAIDELQARRHGQPIIVAADGCRRAITGLGINASALFASELGNRLAEQSGSFGLIWQLGADGQVRVSLRAKGRVNVAEIAENYGGGGHPNAAGFRMPLARFVTEILDTAGRPGND